MKISTIFAILIFIVFCVEIIAITIDLTNSLKERSEAMHRLEASIKCQDEILNKYMKEIIEWHRG